MGNAFEGQTTIETWEREKHNSLVHRRIVRRQIFPYDVGFLANLRVFYGPYMLLWLFPFTPTRDVGNGKGYDGGGVRFEVNGFEDPKLQWPPHDPEKMNWNERAKADKERQTKEGPWTSGVDVTDVDAFRRRQKEDLKRFQRIEELDDNYDEQENDIDGEYDDYDDDDSRDGNEVERGDYDDVDLKWKDSDGNALGDFGVDSDEEDDDDVPISELIRRRKASAQT